MNMCFTEKTKSGFTLVETMLYIGLTLIMITLLSGIGFNIQDTKAKAQALNEVSYNAALLQETIDRVLEKAVSVNVPTLQATSATLSLSMASTTLDPTVFREVDGRLTLKQGVGATTTLSTESVRIENLLFTNTSKDGSRHNIRTESVIASYNPNNQARHSVRETFFSSTVKKQ